MRLSDHKAHRDCEKRRRTALWKLIWNVWKIIHIPYALVFLQATVNQADSVSNQKRLADPLLTRDTDDDPVWKRSRHVKIKIFQNSRSLENQAGTTNLSECGSSRRLARQTLHNLTAWRKKVEIRRLRVQPRGRPKRRIDNSNSRSLDPINLKVLAFTFLGYFPVLAGYGFFFCLSGY